jgi:hypothetical protein
MKKLSLGLLTFAALFSSAEAQLSLSNWSITSDTLSFDISGTFTTTQTPTSNTGLLWLAAPGNGSWINNDMNPSATISGTIDGFDANTSSHTIFSFTGSGTTNVGAYLSYSGMPPFQPGISFNFTDGTNNEVNIHLSMTSAGKYNPANIDPNSLQLYWGGNAFSADTSSAVAMNLTAVPEPSTYAAIAGGVMLLTAAIIRRRGKRTAV